MDDSAERTRVEFHEWGPEPFAIADRRGAPVLLSLSASWCTPCHEMDRATYDEPRIAANLNDGFVPVRVDVDRHPRVRDRYNMGGFPSTVFCTPDGRVVSGAGYLGPDGMRQVLDSVRGLWDRKGAEAGRLPRSLRDTTPPAGELTDGIEGHLAGALEAHYDERAGGWGDGEKFPMPRTIEFALKRDREMALRTLDAVGANLLDEYAGGFFRFAERADWSGIHYEKPLDTNAALVRAFANAYCYTGEERYREPAERTVDYLTTTLWTGDAFAASQAAGAGAAHYTADPSDREAEGEPPVDGTVLADWNALAVDALLTYHAYTDDERAARYAERAMETLRTELLDGDAVVHYRDGEERGESGLLVDHARLVGALCRARQVRGLDTLALARTLADAAIERCFSEGSFVDGPAAGPGLLDRPLRPLDGNVEMAEALLELATLTGEQRYDERAREAVTAFAGAADRFGPQVAAYGSVAARLRRDVLTIRVGTPAGSDLHRAALRVADHEKVVIPGAGEPPSGTAVAALGERSTEPAGDPEALLEAVQSLLA